MFSRRNNLSPSIHLLYRQFVTQVLPASHNRHQVIQLPCSFSLVPHQPDTIPSQTCCIRCYSWSSSKWRFFLDCPSLYATRVELKLTREQCSERSGQLQRCYPDDWLQQKPRPNLHFWRGLICINSESSMKVFQTHPHLPVRKRAGNLQRRLCPRTREILRIRPIFWKLVGISKNLSRNGEIPAPCESCIHNESRGKQDSPEACPTSFCMRNANVKMKRDTWKLTVPSLFFFLVWVACSQNLGF